MREFFKNLSQDDKILMAVIVILVGSSLIQYLMEAV